MNLQQVLTTIFEILMVLTVLWCIFNEDRLVAFEQRLFSLIRRRKLRIVKSKSCRTI